jgi:hypothetical protein
LAYICISVSLGLAVVLTLSVGFALRRERPGKEVLKSAALIPLQFTAEQGQICEKVEWAMAVESSKRHH